MRITKTAYAEGTVNQIPTKDFTRVGIFNLKATLTTGKTKDLFSES